MIGLVGAMNVEMQALIERLEDRNDQHIGMDVFHTGKLFGQDAVLTICGPGKVNAALCTQAMILTYQPQWVLNLGVAGCADDRVNLCDLVIATAVVQHDCDTSPLGDPVGMVSKLSLVELPCDAQLRGMLCKAAAVHHLSVHEGIIATGDQFIHVADMRRIIHERFHALAVEMEGGAVAHACYTLGVPCGVLRTISDRADGHSIMDYPTFVKVAASRSVQVVETLLRSM